MADVFRFPSTPPAPPPKNILRATFFTVIGPSNRPLTCAVYDVATGLELRLSYADDNVHEASYSEEWIARTASRNARTRGI